MTLRTPVVQAEKSHEPVQASNPDVPAGSDAKTSPIVYESKSGKPYLAKVYEAESVWDKLDHDTQGHAEVISEYFKELSGRGEYRTDDVAYRDFLKRYEKLTDTKDAPLTVKLKKIGEFIRYMKRTQ